LATTSIAWSTCPHTVKACSASFRINTDLGRQPGSVGDFIPMKMRDNKKAWFTRELSGEVKTLGQSGPTRPVTSQVGEFVGNGGWLAT